MRVRRGGLSMAGRDKTEGGIIEGEIIVFGEEGSERTPSFAAFSLTDSQPYYTVTVYQWLRFGLDPFYILNCLRGS